MVFFPIIIIIKKKNKNKNKNKNSNNSSDFTGFSTVNFGTWRFGFGWSQLQLVLPMLW